jgi:hypothetical protein
MRVADRIRTDRVHPLELEQGASDFDGCEAIEFVGELVDVSHELADVIASANADVE